MSLTAAQSEKLNRLLFALRDDELTPSQVEELEQLILSDTEAMQHYVRVANLNVGLRWMAEDLHDSEGVDELSDFETDMAAPSTMPPIILDSSAPLHSPFFTFHSPVSSFVFSHVAAALILGIGLLLGLAWRISTPVGGDSIPRSPGVTQNNRRPELPPIVARITALTDCQWTKQGSGVRGSGSGISEIQIPKSPNPQIPVFLGDRLIVSAGLMQITYDTGAKVILEGPCSYMVDSKQSGFLAIGRLTARVETGGGGRGTGEVTSNSEIHNPKSSASRPQSHAPLFAVRTPTAVVTDLGTEFGVEVEESGATRSYVFQGMIEMRSAESSDVRSQDGANANIMKQAVRLGVGESARTEFGPGQVIKIVRQMPLGNPTFASKFSRQIRTRPCFMGINTGRGIKVGDTDPNWQVIACSDDPNFTPRQAVVIKAPRGCPANDPASSQWIAVPGNLPEASPKTYYTFRTMFEVTDLTSQVIRMVLDDHVIAIRVNGHAAASTGLRKQTVCASGRGREFSIDGRSFVLGTNTLELDLVPDPATVGVNPNSAVLRLEFTKSKTSRGTD